ncbi:MAG: Nif3-like dinuclear metal center hexameric protein, partial [Planctomycetes bacterium]|nr:Nif3-like dinuclear metal center hexameric protein [Planctomycetota bacterium]
MVESSSKPARLGAVIDVIESLAPPTLAEPWDKTGLQVGDPTQAVSRALVCIDLTEPVLAEAARRKAELIVAYHPVIFSPLTQLTATHWKQRVLLDAVRKGIAVYCPHTALDAAVGGVNDWLADGLGKGARRPIQPTAWPGSGGNYKLVTFVPPDVADGVRDALSEAGAGVIGHYRRCSFNLAGHGTFQGDETTNPAVGEAGRLEQVEELRMEMVVPRAELAAVVEALYASHPYEEPAFDVYQTVPPPTTSAATEAGGHDA